MKWVFIHGAGGSADFWTLQRPHFPDALLLNLPGHQPQRAAHNAEVVAAEATLPSIDAYADWMERQASKLDDERIVLVGHSMGGAIALTVALNRPSWLAGLVLSSTGAHLPIDWELMRLLSEDYSAAVEWIINRSFAPAANRYRREGVKRQLLRTPAAILAADYLASVDFDCTTSLLAGEISVPTLVICGAFDGITPPKLSEFLHNSIAGSAYGLVDGAGHMAPLEQPERWAALVKSYFFQ